MGIRFSIQKIPVDIRHFRAHSLTRDFRFFLMIPRDGAWFIAGSLCLGLLSLLLAVPARAALVTLGPGVSNPPPFDIDGFPSPAKPASGTLTIVINHGTIRGTGPGQC
jgi:hypothetical protein